MSILIGAIFIWLQITENPTDNKKSYYSFFFENYAFFTECKRTSKNAKLPYKVGMQLDRNSYAIVDDRQTSSLTSTPDWSLVELGFN